MMNIANILTLSRIGLAVIFFFLIQARSVSAVIVAGILFLVAVLTDYYDGYFAKKYNLVSDFGKLMDPIADKFLILVAFFVFVRMGLVGGVAFFLIFLRETVLTGFRLMAMTKGQILAAETAGKLKTAFQMLTILVILVFWVVRRIDPFQPWDDVSRQSFLSFANGTTNVLMFVVVCLTLYSGGLYLWNNRGVFFPSSEKQT